MIDLSVLYNDLSKPKAFYNTIFKSTYTNRHIPAVMVADNRSSSIPFSADYTTHSHAAGVGGRATPCGKENYDQHKYFVAINAASPYELDSKPSDHKLEGKYGCHFEANNFTVYFPDHYDVYWRLEGTDTCVPQACVYVNQTLDYYDESKDNEWEWEWDKGYEVMIHR
jgi:hypothetical protein